LNQAGEVFCFHIKEYYSIQEKCGVGKMTIEFL
jgi:hypothetical protein